MSLEAVRRLAWTAIILFIMAIVFAFNHGPILAWQPDGFDSDREGTAADVRGYLSQWTGDNR